MNYKEKVVVTFHFFDPIVGGVWSSREWREWNVPGTPLEAWPGVGTQPHYEVPVAFASKIDKMQWLTST